MDLQVKKLLAIIIAAIEIISIILMCYFNVPIVVVVLFAILFTLALILIIRKGNKEQTFKNLTVLRKVAYVCCLAAMIGSIIMFCLSPEDGVLFPALIISSTLLSLIGLSLGRKDCIKD